MNTVRKTIAKLRKLVGDESVLPDDVFNDLSTEEQKNSTTWSNEELIDAINDAQALYSESDDTDLTKVASYTITPSSNSYSLPADYSMYETFRDESTKENYKVIKRSQEKYLAAYPYIIIEHPSFFFINQPTSGTFELVYESFIPQIKSIDDEFSIIDPNAITGIIQLAARQLKIENNDFSQPLNESEREYRNNFGSNKKLSGARRIGILEHTGWFSRTQERQRKL